ncbi:MAG: hypothetical protein M0Z76_07060 [Gammaproteobacteria bacterium]|nr:hypothetical protein [Gammaproteobacteria bacterium]
MTIPFDTLAYTHTLRNAGVDPQQADAHAEALVMAFSQGVATRGDLTDLGLRQSADRARMGKALEDRIADAEETLNSRITQAEQVLGDRITVVEKALSDRITRVEKTLNDRIILVEKTLNDRITRVEKTLNDRITRVEKTLNDRIMQVEEVLGGRIDALCERVARLEREFGELRLNMRWGFVVIGLLILLTSPMSTQLAEAAGILH